MNKNQSGPSVPAVLGAAVLTGFALTLALMAACALAVLMGGLPADKIALWADLCLVLGSLCAAFLAAKRSSAWQPLWGLTAGVKMCIRDRNWTMLRMVPHRSLLEVKKLGTHYSSFWLRRHTG